MERRSAIAIAASVAAGLVAASIYVAGTVGVFTPTAKAASSHRNTAQVADTRPVPAKPRIVTVYVDDPAPAAVAAPAPPHASTVSSTAARPQMSSAPATKTYGSEQPEPGSYETHDD
jgi:hypothetical protein